MRVKGDMDNVVNFLLFGLEHIFKKETLKKMLEEYNKNNPKRQIELVV